MHVKRVCHRYKKYKWTVAYRSEECLQNDMVFHSYSSWLHTLPTTTTRDVPPSRACSPGHHGGSFPSQPSIDNVDIFFSPKYHCNNRESGYDIWKKKKKNSSCKNQMITYNNDIYTADTWQIIERGRKKLARCWNRVRSWYEKDCRIAETARRCGKQSPLPTGWPILLVLAIRNSGTRPDAFWRQHKQRANNLKHSVNVSVGLRVIRCVGTRSLHGPTILPSWLGISKGSPDRDGEFKNTLWTCIRYFSHEKLLQARVGRVFFFYTAVQPVVRHVLVFK